MFKLPPQLTIAQVDECKTELLTFIDDNETITLSSDDVEKIDTVGIQLLLAAITYIAAQNKELIWLCNSSVIQNSVKQLGLNEALLTQYLDV
jgi:anti-anti-sigma regulatory factor